MKSSLTLCFLFCAFLSCAQIETFNIGAEIIDPTSKMPKGWLFSFNDQQKVAYAVKVDHEIKQSGQHSVSIQKVNNNYAFGVIDYVIPKVFKGKSIELKGYNH